MPKKITAKKKAPKKVTPKNLKLEDIARVFHQAGVHVDFALEPIQPERFKSDPVPVIVLLDEVERKNKLAAGWKEKNPHIANSMYFAGQSLYLAATWLRAKLDGSIARAQDNESLVKFIRAEATAIVAANMARNPQLIKFIARGGEPSLTEYLCGFLSQFLARNPGLIPDATPSPTHEPPPAS